MRKILFKAKRKDNGEWVEGYYMMKQDYVKGEYAMVNLHNVTMIEIVEQED